MDLLEMTRARGGADEFRARTTAFIVAFFSVVVATALVCHSLGMRPALSAAGSLMTQLHGTLGLVPALSACALMLVTATAVLTMAASTRSLIFGAVESLAAAFFIAVALGAMGWRSDAGSLGAALGGSLAAVMSKPIATALGCVMALLAIWLVVDGASRALLGERENSAASHAPALAFAGSGAAEMKEVPKSWVKEVLTKQQGSDPLSFAGSSSALLDTQSETGSVRRVPRVKPATVADATDVRRGDEIEMESSPLNLEDEDSILRDSSPSGTLAPADGEVTAFESESTNSQSAVAESVDPEIAAPPSSFDLSRGASVSVFEAPAAVEGPESDVTLRGDSTADDVYPRVPPAADGSSLEEQPTHSNAPDFLAGIEIDRNEESPHRTEHASRAAGEDVDRFGVVDGDLGHAVVPPAEALPVAEADAAVVLGAADLGAGDAEVAVENHHSAAAQREEVVAPALSEAESIHVAAVETLLVESAAPATETWNFIDDDVELPRTIPAAETIVEAPPAPVPAQVEDTIAEAPAAPVEATIVETPAVEAVVEIVPASPAEAEPPMQTRLFPVEKKRGPKPPTAEASEESALLIDRAARVVIGEGKASMSFLQRKLDISYNEAQRLLADLERVRVVGPYQGKPARVILVDLAEWEARQSS